MASLPQLPQPLPHHRNPAPPPGVKAGAPGEPQPPYPCGMKTIQTYRWRVLWIGKWVTTRHHAEEAQIRIEHPEAVRVEGTLIEHQVPETEQEMEMARAAHTFSINAGPRIPPPG